MNSRLICNRFKQWAPVDLFIDEQWPHPLGSLFLITEQQQLFTMTQAADIVGARVGILLEGANPHYDTRRAERSEELDSTECLRNPGSAVCTCCRWVDGDDVKRAMKRGLTTISEVSARLTHQGSCYSTHK